MEPAVAGDSVFVGSCGGGYYALDVHTGEMRWSYDTLQDGDPATFHTNPVVTDELVVTGTDGAAPGYVYAFDRETGAVRWKVLPAGGQVAADLARVGDSVFAMTRNGDLVALSLKDGRELWKYPAPEGADDLGGHAIADGGTIYLAGRDRHVHALETSGGKLLWKRELPGSVDTTVTKVGDRLYVGCGNGVLVRLDAGTGEITGRFETAESPGGRLVAIPGGIVYLGYEPSELIAAVDSDLGKVLWTAEPRPWTTVRPMVWRGHLIAGDGAGTLVALDTGTGNVSWSLELLGRLRGLGHTGDTLLVGTIEGKLYAVRRIAEPESSAEEPPVSGEGGDDLSLPHR